MQSNKDIVPIGLMLGKEEKHDTVLVSVITSSTAKF